LCRVRDARDSKRLKRRNEKLNLPAAGTAAVAVTVAVVGAAELFRVSAAGVNALQSD
jgi:hypothetical protein